jgi:hypothetical protein
MNPPFSRYFRSRQLVGGEPHRSWRDGERETVLREIGIVARTARVGIHAQRGQLLQSVGKIEVGIRKIRRPTAAACVRAVAPHHNAAGQT